MSKVSTTMRVKLVAENGRRLAVPDEGWLWVDGLDGEALQRRLDTGDRVVLNDVPDYPGKEWEVLRVHAIHKT